MMYPTQYQHQTGQGKTLFEYGQTFTGHVFRFGRDFCLETSIHGFNHIAVPRRHWIERLLWAAVTTAAIWGAAGVSLGQWQRYSENPTVITIEKDFRTWLFSLPAITFCEKNRVNKEKLATAIAARWGVNPTDEKYSYYERFVSTVANSDLFHLEGYEEFKDDPALNVDLLQLVIDVMPEFDVKATWSHGILVQWFPVLTEAGACYVTNSLALADIAIVKPTKNDTALYPLTCKYSSLSCYVMLEISTIGTFYFHSPYDVADITISSSTVFQSLNRITELSVMETGCGKGVRDLQPKRRGCLYTDEPTKEGRNVYSTNTCRLSCRNRFAIKSCGCKPFYYNYEEGSVCTLAGMWCLAQHSQSLIYNDGDKCACSPQCLEVTFREVAHNDEIWGKGPFANRGAIRYIVQPPRTRYTREIVFYFQDLVVSFGGAAGLFLGASFISFVEIFYFMIERFVKLFTKGNNQKTITVKAKPSTIPYESARIMELNKIMEDQRRFDQRLNMDIYKY